MARREARKAVTAKMYRHFAVVTLITTGALAMATSENNASDLNAKVDAKQAQVIAAGKDIQKNAQPTVIRRANGQHKPSASGWGSDNSGDASGGSGGFGSSYIPPSAGNTAVTASMLRQLKLTPEQFKALPPAARKAVIAQLTGDPADTVSPAEQVQREQAVVSASLARSGFEGPCSDC